MQSKALLTLAAITLISLTAPVHASDQPAESAEQVRPLLVGAEVPRLTLRTSDGSEFDLNAAINEKPAILIFYRGGW